MPKKNRKRIPVNIIAGSLGVGKTTMLNHLLELRPESERWAVLVNEYGLVGLDAALMNKENSSKSPSGVEIKEVAGGCICCSAGFMFHVSLVLLLQRRPDRLLIEPTGLAALSGILDALDKQGVREAVDVRSVVCLVDPARFKDAILRKEAQDQVEAADVLLASRSDLATTAQLKEFHSWASSLFPPKRHIDQVIQGQIPLEILDLVVDRNSAAHRAGHQHGTDHHSHEVVEHALDEDPVKELQCDASRPIVQLVHRSTTASTMGWICWDGLIFDAKSVSCWLNDLARLPGALRTKAVMRTNEGWWAFNFVDGIEEVKPSGHRRDSRLEVVIDGEQFPPPERLEKELRNCLVSS